jgi:phosphatidylserine/phosphatidylglycerophosphate/cardiolipin synthase-like enzyme
LRLCRGEQPVVLRHLLAELAERVDVRLLAWAGAPLPLFRPSRREVARMRDALTKQSRIKCSLDAKERPLHFHHEKTIVIDDHVAFVGGIDLTTRPATAAGSPGSRHHRLARRDRTGRGSDRHRRRRAFPDALARGQR